MRGLIRPPARPARLGAGRRLPALLALALLASACRSLPPAELAALDALTPRLGELLLVGFHGTEAEANPAVARLVCELRVGNLLLFGRNVSDAAQLARLTAQLQALAHRCTGRALLLAVDAEGGRVMRLGPAAGYTPTLSPEELGRAGDLALTELEALRIGGRLRAAGIHWNLAPVVDVGYNPANPVIVGLGRSFGANPVLVTAHARAFVRGMRAAGVRTTLKHFPGHGSSVGDSHTGFVDVTDTADAALELHPYRVLIAERLVDSIMTAHVLNRRLDPRYPATLSRATIEGLLRRELGFEGLVVSDDLRMAAIEARWGLGEAAVLALAAGVDVLLVADDALPDGESAARVVVRAVTHALRTGRLPVTRVMEALGRVERFRARLEERRAPAAPTGARPGAG